MFSEAFAKKGSGGIARTPHENSTACDILHIEYAPAYCDNESRAEKKLQHTYFNFAVAALIEKLCIVRVFFKKYQKRIDDYAYYCQRYRSCHPCIGKMHDVDGTHICYCMEQLAEWLTAHFCFEFDKNEHRQHRNKAGDEHFQAIDITVHRTPFC